MRLAPNVAPEPMTRTDRGLLLVRSAVGASRHPLMSAVPAHALSLSHDSELLMYRSL